MLRGFFSEEEEVKIVRSIDSAEWQQSQSGRRKQVQRRGGRGGGKQSE